MTRPILLCTLPMWFALLFPGCAPEETTGPPPPAPAVLKGVLILNEGNFQRGNASLSLFLPDSGMMVNDVYQALTGKPLGDTGNSLTLHNGYLYIVVNGSNRVEVLELSSGRHVRTIDCPPGSSPRYIAFGSDGYGYISNIYTNCLSIYDPATNEITGRIPVGNNPEQMLVHGNDLYVANSGFGNGNTVSVVDLSRAEVVKTLNVGDNPVWIERKNPSEALVLCAGAYHDFADPNDDTPGALYTIDLTTRSVIDSLTLGGHPQRLTLDGAGHCYTVQQDGIQRVDLSAKRITERFISGRFSTVLFDVKRSLVYAADPLDYLQPGRFFVYDTLGRKLGTYTVGIIPGAMLIAE
ncbi:MAG: hypothetical protein QHI48_02925 [Bacteroidota bacterium]|nr:hypothetical protein [Bacteroidota bacterium]